MSKAKTLVKSVPTQQAGKQGSQRWSDQWPCEPRKVERRFAQRIGGDTGSMDKPVPKAGK